METVKLNNGIEVLAKNYKGSLCAFTYSNRTQAEKKAIELGNEWAVYKGLGRPFYIKKLS